MLRWRSLISRSVGLATVQLIILGLVCHSNGIRAQAQQLPANQASAGWLSWIASIDFEQPSVIYPDTTGSTSCALEVRMEDKRIGTFFPPSSTQTGNPTTQVAYFNVARVLKKEEVVRKATPHTLRSRAISEFKHLLNDHCQNSPARLQNRKLILDLMEKSPNALAGAFNEKKLDDTVAIDDSATRSVLFNYLRASQPMPRADKIVAYKEHYRDQLAIARELSIALTLDVVLGQWDRYSGGNFTVQLRNNNNVKEFGVYFTDNGGATITSQSAAKKSATHFERYDRSAIATLASLQQFLEGKLETFLGFVDRSLFLQTLGITAAEGKGLSANIGILNQAVATNRQKYGDANVFLPE